MRRFTRARVAVALTAVALLGSACGLQDQGRQSSDDVLDIVGPFEVHSLDPASSDGFFTRLQVVETLVSSDMEGEVVPGLATSWSPADDHRVWEFRLPEDVTFHDGSALTPEAVATSLTTAAEEPASPLAEAPIERIEAADSGIRFRLSEPHLTLPALLTHYSTAVLAPGSYDERGKVTEVIGTGPYRVENLELPATIETTRFAGWRGEAPDIEHVHFQAVGRAESRALVAAGEQADVVFGLEPAGRERVEATDGVRMESSLQPRALYLKVNGAHPALGDVRVRRALSLALDREAIATAILREKDLAATQLFPPSLTTWNQPDLPGLEHDPEEARELLAEAGVGPLRLTLVTYPDRPELPALATAIQAALREIGVELEVKVANSSEIPAGHADGSLELGLLARHLALVADPLVTVADTFSPQGSDWGVMNWQDDAVTDAVDELVAGAPEERAQELRSAIATTVQDDLPLIPVAWYRMNAAVSDRVQGFVLDPLEHTWRITDARWAP
jgi:peptide/nickel transport system substrate-binding protein